MVQSDEAHATLIRDDNTAAADTGDFEALEATRSGVSRVPGEQALESPTLIYPVLTELREVLYRYASKYPLTAAIIAGTLGYAVGYLIEIAGRRKGRMPNSEQIKNEMARASGATLQELGYITDDFILKRQATARPLSFHPSVSLLSNRAVAGTYQGNHLIASGVTWSWQDTPGGCGQAQSWTHTAKQGDRYRKIGTCPQGYILFDITII